MILIAHRGLTNGPDKQLENKPEQILASISKGFDCEIDLWVVSNELWLGHDLPQYAISEEFLKNNYKYFWIHAKNLSALEWLTTTSFNYEYFWHQSDDFTLTSKGFIWTYPGKELTYRSIQVMPEWENSELKNINYNCYAVCSDYVDKLK